MLKHVMGIAGKKIFGVNYFGGSRKIQAEYVQVLASQVVRPESLLSGNEAVKA